MKIAGFEKYRRKTHVSSLVIFCIFPKINTFFPAYRLKTKLVYVDHISPYGACLPIKVRFFFEKFLFIIYIIFIRIL